MAQCLEHAIYAIYVWKHLGILYVPANTRLVLNSCCTDLGKMYVQVPWATHAKQKTVSVMDEGTLKTPIPKCRLYWSFCLGWSSNFVGSESGKVHKYSSYIHGGNSSQAGSKIPTMSECLSSLLYKIC